VGRAREITQILRPADKQLANPVMGCSIRTDHWRFTQWAEGRRGTELYDHYSDPMEFRNLAIKPDAQAKAVIGKLRPMLRRKASGKAPTTPFNQPRL
jgi:iduronate 2-sulfatase